jgi:hypothetical protein
MEKCLRWISKPGAIKKKRGFACDPKTLWEGFSHLIGLSDTGILWGSWSYFFSVDPTHASFSFQMGQKAHSSCSQMKRE